MKKPRKFRNKALYDLGSVMEGVDDEIDLLVSNCLRIDLEPINPSFLTKFIKGECPSWFYRVVIKDRYYLDNPVFIFTLKQLEDAYEKSC